MGDCTIFGALTNETTTRFQSDIRNCVGYQGYNSELLRLTPTLIECSQQGDTDKQLITKCASYPVSSLKH